MEAEMPDVWSCLGRSSEHETDFKCNVFTLYPSFHNFFNLPGICGNAILHFEKRRLFSRELF
jgi:hypothetical protein